MEIHFIFLIVISRSMSSLMPQSVIDQLQVEGEEFDDGLDSFDEDL